MEILDAIEEEFDICFNDDCNLEYVCTIIRIGTIINDRTFVYQKHNDHQRILLGDMRLVKESYLKKIAAKTAKAQRNLDMMNAALAKN